MDNDRYVQVVFLRRNLADGLRYRAEDPEACLGRAVVVPLQGQLTVGIGVELVEASSEEEPEAVQKILDFPPALPEELLSLGVWMGTYYLCSLHATFRRILPSSYLPKVRERWTFTDNNQEVLSDLIPEDGDSISFDELSEAWTGTLKELRSCLDRARQKDRGSREFITDRPEITRRTYRYVELTADEPDDEELTERERDLLEHLGEHGDGFQKDLPAPLRRSQLLERAERKELIERSDRAQARVPGVRQELDPTDPEHDLTPDQETVLESLRDDVESGEHGVHLIHGVTGSGKTEVYFRAAQRALDRDRGVLVLVPEITLASFQAQRFVERFGEQVAVWHSDLSAGERRDEWERIQSGEARVVLGVQSAVFAPLPDLGLIVVDEEHDGSYKAGQEPRYHARDVAVKRGQLAEAPVLLGSATPSLESYANHLRERYEYHTMTTRPEGGSPAGVDVQDLRQEDNLLTKPLLERTGRALQSENRAIWFLNRRGSAQFLLCEACGSVPECDNCSVSLTYHRRPNRLRCHYCGETEPVPTRCPSCGEEELASVGSGTERLAAVGEKLFGDERVFRMDADTVTKKGAREDILDKFSRSEGGLLVGTQMVTKGLDFEDLIFVGVVNADVSLHFPDFRSSERTFQQLLQVIGRAGRDRPDASVLVQTYNPGHDSIQQAVRADYEGFASGELSQRRSPRYPPFSRLIDFRARGSHEDQVIEELEGVCEKLPEVPDGHLLGPTPCGMEYVQGECRWHVLARGRFPRGWKQSVRGLQADNSSVRLTIDVDPVDLL